MEKKGFSLSSIDISPIFNFPKKMAAIANKLLNDSISLTQIVSGVMPVVVIANDMLTITQSIDEGYGILYLDIEIREKYRMTHQETTKMDELKIDIKKHAKFIVSSQNKIRKLQEELFNLSMIHAKIDVIEGMLAKCVNESQRPILQKNLHLEMISMKIAIGRNNWQAECIASEEKNLEQLCAEQDHKKNELEALGEKVGRARFQVNQLQMTHRELKVENQKLRR